MIMDGVSITTFNCRGVKRTCQHVKDICQSSDIIALQETWLLPHDLTFLNTIDQEFGCFAKSSVDTSLGILRGRPYGGLALMWRKSLFEKVTVIQCENNRISAMRVQLNANAIIVFSVYLPCDEPDNLVEFTECLATIAAIIADSDAEAAFVLGDFNADASKAFGGELSRFCSDNDLICVDEELLPKESFTYVSEAHGTRSWLDHILTTRAARRTVISVKIEYGVYWSDHVPLTVKCDLGKIVGKTFVNTEIDSLHHIRWGKRDQTQIDLYTKLSCDILSKIKYEIDCEDCVKGLCKSHLDIIDNFYDNIVKSLQSLATLSRNCKRGARGRARQIVGWNYHVKDMHDKAKIYYAAWTLAGRPTSGTPFENMKSSRSDFKNKLKWCQNNESKIQQDVLALHQANKNFPKFWNATKKLNTKPSMPITVDNVNGPRNIAELFSHHFRVKPLPCNISSAGSRSKVYDKERNCFSISAAEVAQVVKQMKRGKSPGWDGLSIEHVLHANHNIYVLLSKLFTMCYRLSYLPKNLMKTIVVPVPKSKTGDLSSTKNYRPISLGTIIGKIFERIIHPDLKSSLKIDDAQFGFRANLSTDAAIFSLKTAVKYYTDRNTSVYACFLDLSRAFDQVNYTLLWEKLEGSGVPQITIQLLKYWYENQVNCVRWGDATSSEFRLECGVRQGGLTSPDLFNIYVNGLIEELRGTRVGCNVAGVCLNNLSYADDMVLLGPSINALNRLISICELYVKAHGLQYNVAKTQFMVFRAGKGPERVPQVLLNEAVIQRVEQFRYLGHILTSDLNDDADIERERRAMAVRGNMIARRFAGCTRDVKLTLFRAYCLCFYTCQLWVRYTQRSMSVIRVQYNDTYRILMKLPRYCSASNMFAEAGVTDFFGIIRSRVAGFWSRLRTSKNTILASLTECMDCSIFKHWVHVHHANNRK